MTYRKLQQPKKSRLELPILTSLPNRPPFLISLLERTPQSRTVKSRQITDGVREEDTEPNKGTGEDERNTRKRSKPMISQQIRHTASENVEIKYEHQSGPKPGDIYAKASATSKANAEKNNDYMSMPNARVRYMKDQLVRAKVYLSLTGTRNSAHFVRELRLRVKEVQRTLGLATKDSELPRNAYEKLKLMDQTLAKGKQIQDDCAAMVKTLCEILHSTEEHPRVQRKQTIFLTQLTAKMLPKGLHCLSLRLLIEYYALNSSQQQFPHQENLDDLLYTTMRYSPIMYWQQQW
ncbi:hypothetical protein Nepgr_007049 [Nepenthes gracilis]|uniref:Uncharacterized protein n=1 Tax=Nepenthes gracilis TaxID=150966 RepID=A0AAD3S6C7_NEPGR|nr:hypothetical protein Nepgr_007049 [Nepenthes gracilis]